MKPTYTKPLWLSALCMGAVLGACSNDAEQAPSFGTTDEAPGRIEFTISLPGGSGVLYPTRMIQSDLECKISSLDVLEFRDSLDDAGNPVMWDGTDVPARAFVAYHTYADIKLSPAANPNQYTFSINKKEGDKAKHYFYFIANHDQESIEAMGNNGKKYSLKVLAEQMMNQEDGTDEERTLFLTTNPVPQLKASTFPFMDFEDYRFQTSHFYYNIGNYNFETGEMNFTDTAYGMRMSGVATTTRHGAIGGDNDTSGITIPENGSVQCFVDMTRVAARIDLYSDASNLVITDAVLHQTFSSGFYFLQGKPEIDWNPIFGDTMHWDDYVAIAYYHTSLNSDSEVTDRLFTAAYDPADADNVKKFQEKQAAQQWNEVYDVDHGVQKAFYCYETPNSLVQENVPEYVSYVEVKFMLLDGTTGHVNVPFTKTAEDGTVTGVDIVRNNLYRVVIGDGEPVSPGADIKVRIEDVPWTVVDLPAIVD